MTRVIEVPTSFDERSFDQFAAAVGDAGEERMLFDAHAVKWASPYALLGLLVAGQSAVEKNGIQPQLTVPTDRDVSSYVGRTGFYEYAAEWFEIHGKTPQSKVRRASDVLLEITPVRGSEDVHGVVGVIQERASAILTGELGLESQATLGFGMALSEACQNIVEHAETSGWVAVQTYEWRRRLGRRVVVIAVADSGIGFRRSLKATEGRKYGDRWNDATALEAALMHGVSRFPDQGRGQGLLGIRRYVTRWDGRLSVRSGTARISIVENEELMDMEPMEDGLPEFPGSQMLQIIPARNKS